MDTPADTTCVRCKFPYCVRCLKRTLALGNVLGEQNGKGECAGCRRRVSDYTCDYLGCLRGRRFGPEDNYCSWEHANGEESEVDDRTSAEYEDADDQRADEDAMDYIYNIRDEFEDQPAVFNQFLELMIRFSNQTIGISGVIDVMSSLHMGWETIQEFDTVAARLATTPMCWWTARRFEVDDAESAYADADSVAPPPSEGCRL
jgi:hypothetical protein